MDLEEKKLSIKLAYGYYQNAEYNKAIDLYKKLYEADPEDFNVLNMLGDTHFKNGDKAKALESYIDTIMLLEKKEHYEKAIKLCKKIQKFYPDDERINNKIKSSVRFLVREAEKKTLQHEYAAAREIYEKITEFSSEEFPINIKLKELNDEEQKYLERARKIQEQQKASVKEDPQKDLIDKFDNMAQNYLNNGDFDGAVETYITALKLAPNNEELKEKLHSVYMLVAQSVAGERIWEKIERGGSNRLEDVKKRAMEDRQAKILQEEEEKARKLLEEEKKIQSELEQKETYIIKKAADELKVKLDEAERTEKLKAEEIKRIMEEQEKKKQELLESAKREAIEKWKKQKEMMQQEMPAPEPSQPKAEFSRVIPDNQVEKQRSVMDYLKQAYEVPRVGETETKDAVRKEQPREDTIVDDIGEKEPAGKKEDDIIVSEKNLDSLITTAHIYISQNMLKEAMHIFNKVSEKYPDHAEVKQLLQEIAKRKNS